MKQGKTISQLAVEIERQQAVKKDFIANTRAMKFGSEKDGSFIEIAGQGAYRVNDLTHGQVATHLEIPKKYYDRMRADNPGLLDVNVNSWLQKTGQKRMVRTLDGTARAFLSDRYRRLDNFDLAEAILPVIGGSSGLVIESADITDTRLYLKVSNPRLEMEVKKGDPVQSGFIVSNSEVGAGSLYVHPFIKRLVCLNGMVAEDFGQKRYHVGKQAAGEGEAYEMYSDETLKADDRAFWLKVSDTIRATLESSKFEKIVRRLTEATEQRIEGDPVEAVEVLGNHFTLNETERKSALRHLVEGGDLSAFGLVQAVTEVSKEVADYDRATELEAFGGRILNLDKSMWKQIATAGVN